MARKRIIDLRDAGAASRTLSSSHQTEEKRTVSIAAPAPEKEILFEWSAPEYAAMALLPYWYVWPGAAALALIILGIAVQNFFFVTFCALAFAVIVMYVKRPPREIHCVISPKGISIGRTFHKFSDIKSFAIFDEEALPELSLEVDRISTPYIRVPLGDIHSNRVRAVLSDYIHEEQHKDSLTDQVARSFGF